MPKTKFFYQKTAAEAVKKLKSDAKRGLSSAEAGRRLMQYGPNVLEQGKRRPMFLRFFDQFKDLLIIVLIIAALLAYYLGDFRGGTILLVIVLVNAIIGFYQEFKAEKILDSLKKIIKARATVIRGGQKIEIEQASLVPGDIVFLEEGGSITADVRLIDDNNFATNDFILTGESVPQPKSAKLLIEKEITITDQDNCVFLGTTVATGNATAVVYGTGMNTAIGRIAKTSSAIEHDQSPLQKEIHVLAKALTKIAGVIALALFLINLLLTAGDAESLQAAINLSVLFAISVAAASVPQGLPAQISVALSLGVGRLGRKNAVVKKLSSVETLGSTTVICSDKTGTLTQNEMTIVGAYNNSIEFQVTGTGYSPDGQILSCGRPVTAKHVSQLKPFFEDGFLASNGRTSPPDGGHPSWYAIGDPTEAAFTPFVIKAGLNPGRLEKDYPVIDELPFDSDRKRITIIRRHKGKQIAYMKGGLAAVLKVCSHIMRDGKKIKLTPKLVKEIKAKGEQYSSQALRVIALAYRDLPKTEKTYSIKKTEQKFIFAGFVAMIDPPRPEVKEAIKNTYNAHIKLHMITGDNRITAAAIARQIGMHSDGKAPTVFKGDDIKKMSDAKLKKILTEQSVIFSRVSPEDKYRLVSLLKSMGQIVAVTGDGVNDTLSLKKSDIGVAMGKLGSDVAKEASEIVLLDDNFATLTVAIKEGRTIFRNLKKTILSSITSNNGELSCVLLGFIGVAMGLPNPITAVQILAIDLVGEMLPLTALTFDPPEEGIMQEKPRSLKEHIINRGSLKNLIFYGFFMGAAGYYSFYMVLKFGAGTTGAAQAAAYAGIIFCQFVNILSRRTERTIFTRYLFSNKQLWGSFLFSIIAIWLLINVPAISIWFGFEALSLSDWIYPIIGALFFLFLHEGRKFIKQI